MGQARRDAEPSMRMSPRVATIAGALSAVLVVAGCGSSTAPLEELHAKADHTLDLTGSGQPADLATHDSAARAAVAVTAIVAAAAEVLGELANAVGDLVPTEDHPCPDGGSASGDISGSFNHPRVHMSFHNCVRGEHTLDGVADVRCDELDGSRCVRGDVTIGEGGAVLYFRDPARVILTRGLASISSDQAAQSLHADTSLEGELRALSDEPGWSFVTGPLAVDLHKSADDTTEVRIEGIAGVGGRAAAANCLSGRFDTETPADPLVLQAQVIRSGGLRLHSPPPRPGSQQAEAVYADGGASVRGADGGQLLYSPQALAEFCTTRENPK